MMHEFRRDAIKRTVTIYRALDLIHVTLPQGELTQQVACPFHNDTHPSARVYDDHLFCFTCGKSWDAIDLVQQTYHMPYLAAMEWLESECQILPADVDPLSMIRATLRAKPGVPVGEFFTHVEAQVCQARNRLTCAQFARYTTVLDVLQWQLDSKAITREAVATALQTVLARVS